MKKLLTILSAITLITTASTTIVSCSVFDSILGVETPEFTMLRSQKDFSFDETRIENQATASGLATNKGDNAKTVTKKFYLSIEEINNSLTKYKPKMLKFSNFTDFFRDYYLKVSTVFQGTKDDKGTIPFSVDNSGSIKDPNFEVSYNILTYDFLNESEKIAANQKIDVTVFDQSIEFVHETTADVWSRLTASTYRMNANSEIISIDVIKK